MDAQNHKNERIAKRLARAGLCSRREAERWIEQGRVKVNGHTLESPAHLVGPEDRIAVDGKPVQAAEDTRLWLYHKPAGLVTTHKDEQGRRTVFDALPEFMPRVISIGRLDLNTEGLLLLTNDGALSRYLELPSTGWTRKYKVRVLGNVQPEKLAALKYGIAVDGIRYKSIDVQIEPDKNRANTWLGVTLREGKNREIRRIMEAMDLRVNRLIRLSYGPFSLGKLEQGAVQEVKERVLKDQIAGYFQDKA